MALYDVFSELSKYVDFQFADAERLAELAPLVIAERHGGGLHAANLDSGGASFVVTFQTGTGT